MFQLTSEFVRGKGTLSVQLAAQIRRAIDAGDLRPGDRLPATRSLAGELGLSRGTVATAFELLIAEGLLESRSGSGTFVSSDALIVFDERAETNFGTVPEPLALPVPDVDKPRTATIDFRPCRPSTQEFPLQVWRRCLSFAASSRPVADYGDPRGSEELREEIARYLRRARGMQTTADRIIISNGAVHAMHLLAAIYLNYNDRVVFEDPGYPLARQTFELRGARMHYCGVDEQGMDLNDLPQRRQSVRFVYVTPSHQFPTGSRLSLGRRQALLQWASQTGALIIEDDYDGEFRYDVPPLAPLAAMAPQAVVYCGTFSKTMFPGLRIGYAVADKTIINAMARYRSLVEYAPGALPQAALARFIASRGFERHVHKMRRVYSEKRRAVQAAVSEHTVSARLSGIESGLNVLLDIEESQPAETLARHAAAKGILVPALSRYTKRTDAKRNALVLGYAAPSLAQIAAGTRQLFNRE